MLAPAPPRRPRPAERIRRWPWVLALLAVTVCAAIVLTALARRQSAAQSGQVEAARYAQETASVVKLVAGGHLRLEGEDALALRILAVARIARLAEMAGDDPRLSRIGQLARNPRLSDARALAEMSRMTQEIERIQARNARHAAVEMRVGAAVTLLTLAGMVLLLLRNAQRALLRESTHHADVLRQLAHHDPLTGLGNRRALREHAAAVVPAATTAAPVRVAVFDLDRFKAYNDVHGHAAGDALLIEFADRFSRAVGARGTLYRLGGDEFCLVSAGGWYEHPERLLGGRLAGGTAGVSGGAALVPAEAATLDEALELADRRLYADKASRARADAGAGLATAASA
ncbi:MAG TPA: GGDEF domain-containing protein [Baekduia sp.]|nr:GGDEF domain-containing protein [Baekduia sp.]